MVGVDKTWRGYKRHYSSKRSIIDARCKTTVQASAHVKVTAPASSDVTNCCGESETCEKQLRIELKFDESTRLEPLNGWRYRRHILRRYFPFIGTQRRRKWEKRNVEKELVCWANCKTTTGDASNQPGSIKHHNHFQTFPAFLRLLALIYIMM